MNPREKRQDTRWLWDDNCYRVSNRQCLCSSRGHPCCNHSNRHDLASADRMSIGLEARQFSSYEWLHSSSTAPLPFSGSGAGQAEQQNQQPERKPNIFSAISVVSNVPEMLQCSSVNMTGLLSSGFNANMMSSSSQGLPQNFAYGGEGPANILGLVEAHRSLFEKSEDAAAAAAGGRIEFGLGLGQRTYFPSEDNNYPMSRFYKRPKPLSAINIPRCQAEGCRADLSTAKNYHRRHKVCEIHSKASTVISGGLTQRFCQQCSRFHVLSEFDEGKRSCRKRLADHNRRRRKPQVQAGASSVDTAAPAAKSNTEQEQERNSANNQSSSQHRQMEQSDAPYLPGMSLSPRSVQPTSKALQAPNLSLSADPEADNGYNGLEIAIPWLRTAEFGGSERNQTVTAEAARVSDAAVCSSTTSNAQIFSSVQNLLSPRQTCSQWREAPKLQQALNSRSQSSAAVNPTLQGSFQSHEMLGIFPGTVEANYHQHDEDLKSKRILRGLQSVRSLYHNSL